MENVIDKKEKKVSYTKTVSTEGTITLHPADNEHLFTVVYLHGLSQQASALEKNFDTFYPSLRIVLPQAPEVSCDKYDGKVVPSWYNVFRKDWDDLKTDE